MFVEGGACATAQWHNGQSKPAAAPPVWDATVADPLRQLALFPYVLTRQIW